MGNGDSLLRYTVSGTLRRESPLPTAVLAGPRTGPKLAPPFASSCFVGLLGPSRPLLSAPTASYRPSLPSFLRSHLPAPAQHAQQGAVTESTYL